MTSYNITINFTLTYTQGIMENHRSQLFIDQAKYSNDQILQAQAHATYSLGTHPCIVGASDLLGILSFHLCSS